MAEVDAYWEGHADGWVAGYHMGYDDGVARAKRDAESVEPWIGQAKPSN